MSTIQARLRQIEPGALFTGFEAKVTALGELADLYFYNPKDPGAGNVVWQSKTYVAYPVESDGYETSSKGVLPRPVIAIGNTDGAMSALCRLHNDMVGCVVIRHRTLREFLDGQPGADPTQEITPDSFVVDRKRREDNTVVEWELATKIEATGKTIPGRQMLANACRWLYRGDDCGHSGTCRSSIKGVVMGAHFTDGVANGSTTFTSATANFTSADIGKAIQSDTTAIPLDTGILSINSTTSVELTRAVTAATGILFTVVGRVTDRGAYNPATTYAKNDQAYTIATGTGVRLYWYSLTSSNTAPLTDITKWTLDRCPKTTHACKLRFGPTGVLRTSAFPGINKLV